MELYKNAPKLLEFYINRANGHSIKTLEASYAVSELVSIVGKSHSIAKRLVSPAMSVCTKKLLAKEAAYTLQKIPLFTNRVRRSQTQGQKTLRNSWWKK